jgi:hypothetical protein
MATGYNVRVGDADRDAAAAQLREHYADGRLTLDELNERLDQTFGAKTKADLNTVMRDLPTTQPWAGAGPAGSGTGTWQGPAWPGPMATRSGWDHHHDHQGHGAGSAGRASFFAPLMGLVWVFVILGSVFFFGLGGGRPFFVVIFLAVLALVRRLVGMGRRRGMGPRGRRR